MVALPENVRSKIASLGECRITATSGTLFIHCENKAVALTVNRSQFWKPLKLGVAITIDGHEHSYARASDLHEQDASV